MNYTLTVDLLAEAAVGTGSGSAEVDREVPIDHRGLPVIAGRRLKGLLREATLEVWEALLQARGEAWTSGHLLLADVLYGTAARPGLVAVGSAQLVAVVDPNSRVSSVESLDSWVTYLEHEGGTLWQRMALDAFTSVRSQTAIDPESGAARDNTLRSTRVLRRHLRFQAPVTLSDDEGDGDRSERTLALAAAALQRLGTSRNRGFGRAKAGLWKGRENLTERQLRWLDGVARRGVAR